MTPDQFASLAQSLKDNEVFQQAMGNIRSAALEALATMPRSDEQAFYAAQARVAVVDEAMTNIEQFIRSGRPPRHAGIA